MQVYHCVYVNIMQVYHCVCVNAIDTLMFRKQLDDFRKTFMLYMCGEVMQSFRANKWIKLRRGVVDPFHHLSEMIKIWVGIISLNNRKFFGVSNHLLHLKLILSILISDFSDRKDLRGNAYFQEKILIEFFLQVFSPCSFARTKGKVKGYFTTDESEGPIVGLLEVSTCVPLLVDRGDPILDPTFKTDKICKIPNFPYFFSW